MARRLNAPTTREVRTLVAQLENLGVTLPPEVAPLLAADDRISAANAYAPGPAVALADLGPDDVLRWTLLHLSSEAIRETRVQASDRIAAACVEAMKAAAPDIIDQLRPAFDEAASHFLAARNAGVTEHSTPAELLDMPAKSVTAWRALAEHLPTLTAIASARIEMSHTLSLPPNTRGSNEDYSACFSLGCSNWDGNRSNVADWLRLATTGLKLMQPNDTAALTRVIPAPLVPA